MTTISEAREVVYERVRSLWIQSIYTLEGDAFIEPTDAPWVRWSVRQRGGGQITLGGVGNRRFQRDASVHAQAFVPLGQGLQENDDLAQAALALFEAVPRLGGLEFNSGTIMEIGPKGNKQQHNVEIEFSYHERK